MATNTSTPRARSIVAGLVLAAGVAVAGLALRYGPSGVLDLLWSGVLGVLYVVLPVAILAILLLGFFRFNAWRQ